MTISSDRRVTRTRKLLRDALIQLILEQGYDAIRVQDITDKANLGRATFYIHYKDKEDLLLDAIEDLRQELYLRVQSEPDSSPLPGFRALFAHAAENRAFYQAIFHRVRGQQQIRRVMVDAIQSGLAALGSESEIPGAFISHFLAGAALQLLDWWLSSDMPYSIDEMESMFLNLMRQGLPAAFKTNATEQS